MVPPTNIPAWVSAGGFAGLFVYTPPEDPEDLHLVARAVAFPNGRDSTSGVIVDLPLDEQVLEQIHQSTGIEPGAASLVREQDPVQPMTGRQRGDGEAPPVMRTIQTGTGSKWLWNWLVFMDFRDWERGETATFNMAIRVSMRDLYQRISSAQSRIMNRTIGEFTLLFLGIIGFLFIIIEFAAFVMGLTLALSITAIDPLALPRHRARPLRRLRASHRGARSRSARRTGGIVQRDDRQHRGPARSRRRRSGASRKNCASPARSRCRCCRAARCGWKGSTSPRSACPRARSAATTTTSSRSTTSASAC